MRHARRSLSLPMVVTEPPLVGPAITTTTTMPTMVEPDASGFVEGVRAADLPPGHRRRYVDTLPKLAAAAEPAAKPRTTKR